MNIRYLVLLFFFVTNSAFCAPRVVASIIPVHSLVAAVMQGVGEPQLLMQGGISPHDYALRPSDMNALAVAELVFWVGPVLESSFSKAIRQLRDVRSVALLDTPGLLRLPLREGGLWESSEHDRDHPAKEPLSHEASNPHIWLDPANAGLMLGTIAEILIEADPKHQPLYQRNRDAYQERLQGLASALEQRLEPVKTKPYIVFHDAYPYFEQRFGLHPAGSITLHPERAPSAKRVQQIRERIKDSDIRCVFAEPQFEPALIEILIADTASRSGVLDPLGMTLNAGPDAYFQLMEMLASALVECLQE